MKTPIYNIECRINELPEEARYWLDYYSSGLCWEQYRWRIWESPAEEHELSISEVVERKFAMLKGFKWEPPLRKRHIDAVRFSSRRDAMYFKIRWL